MARDLSFDRAIRFAAELVRIPSPPGGEGEVADRVRRELEDLGFQRVTVDEVGNVTGVAPGRGRGPTVMLSSHLDAVDVGEPAGWEYPPFSGVIADGFLHGRGAADIKGPLALQTYAAAHFLEEPGEGDVIVAHTVFEEKGGWGMEHLLASGRVRPDIVVLGESTNGDICVGHRGRAELIVEIRGRAGHASAPERACNAIDLLPTVLPAIREFAAQLPEDSILGRSTLVATNISTLPASPNVIPDTAQITVDWRVLPGLSADAAEAALRDFLLERVEVPEGWALDVRYAVERQRTYTGAERDRRLFTSGFLLAPDHPVVRSAVTAIERATGRRPAVRPWTFATDGGHACGRHGIPTIGFAPGEERFAHTNRERLPLDDARRIYEAYPDLIRALQAV
ncbi:MAG TPA: M20/M25/M40 family metallo-hydrolase [Longimicrobiales bacterium]|nr:M20/M25/M40 family metallo-hydrolase [Longimicrobiales bacterium]